MAARGVVQSDHVWAMMNSVPDGWVGRDVDGVPAECLDFLRLANGGIFGSVVVFGVRSIEKLQFYADSVDDAPVVLGRGEWFCFGKVNDDPLFVNRHDGSVWGFPDVGVVWWQSHVFERLAGSVGEFLVEYVFGSGYSTLSGVEEDDQWQRLVKVLLLTCPDG